MITSMRRLLRRMLGRRERVVPVVTRSRRRCWVRAAPDDHASRLHLLYLEHRDRYQPAYFARSGAYPMPRRGWSRALRWYVADVMVQAVLLVRRHGRSVRKAAGVPVRRQFRELLWLSVTVPSMPEKYYTFEWYRPAQRNRVPEYLHRHETKGGLYEMLADAGDLAEVAPLTDKVAFARLAAAHGVPAIPTLGVVNGDVADCDAALVNAGELPAADVFVKPIAGKGGRGIEKWSYCADRDAFRGSGQDAREVPRDGLLAALAGRARQGALVVQPCLTNHPELADLALDAVVTCRVITIINEAGDPEPVIAIFRMPAVPETVVDNMHQGGLAAPVAIGTGTLGAGTGYAVVGPAAWHTHHPGSGAPIAGRQLPLWDDVLALAARAHRAFEPRVLVGWDISIGPAGPVIIEGNEQPGVDGLQRLHNQPLGSHRFGQLLVHHLERRFPAPLRRSRRPIGRMTSR